MRGARSEQNQRDLIPLHKLQSLIGMTAKYRFDIAGRAVPTANPDYSWWHPGNQTALQEIGILRHNGEVLRARKVPNGPVIGAVQTDRLDVHGFRIDIGERIDQRYRSDTSPSFR